MASIKQDVSLGHAATTAASVQKITLAAGTPVEILKEWKEHYLVKTAEGKLFNVRKEFVDAG